MPPVVFVLIISVAGYLIYKWLFKSPTWKTPTEEFPVEWRTFLIQNISFYNTLSNEEKDNFEFRIQEFLLNCRITGIETQIETADKIFIASSAIIPVFKFPEWKYKNLNEVLVYPSSFNNKFETSGPDRTILGMVGTGYMEGKMILSQQALKNGFRNETDKKNTAIHEFVHLIDKADGSVDGIPAILLEKQYTIPWIDLINKKIDEIQHLDSDINPYGATNRAEFLSVVSEYFFERPELLAKKHPELYKTLEKIFKHNLSSKKAGMKKKQIGRNSPCPCNSGKKFKNCCGRIHFK